jgi:integrase
VKRNELKCKPHSRRYPYTKVLDARKQPIRGLWQRNGQFVARLAVEDDVGQKRNRWVPLENASTVSEARAEFHRLLVERRDNRLRHIGQTPKLVDYLRDTYLPRLEVSGKRPRTIEKERGCLKCWSEAVGHHRLDKLRPFHLTGFLDRLKRAGLAGRTCNLYLMSLRNLLKSARLDGFLKPPLPCEGIPWQKCDVKSRTLVAAAELDRICEVAFKPLFYQGRLAQPGEPGKPLRNAQEFADYIRFLTYTGARRDEALTVRWADVDFNRKLVTIGAEGDTKAREPRRVDFNPTLEAHLKGMMNRRAPDSQWLFPSPQRGEADTHVVTFMESLKLARLAAGLPHVGFHDCRHFFISYAVMSGVDFLTIARWVGHADGGVLIGKVYGHLSDSHAKAQAQRLCFGPVLVTAAA